MILVDTSVWIEHLQAGNDRLKTLLFDGQVLCHPFVIGELTQLGRRRFHSSTLFLARKMYVW